MENASKAGPKRSKIQREYDLQEVTALYCQGWYQSKIVEHLAKHRPYKVTQQTISYDLKAIKKKWLASSLRDFDEARSTELSKIDNLEAVAWSEYLKSQEPVIKKKTVMKIDGHTTEATQEGQTGLGDPKYLDTVKWCIDRRIKLLGLDAPVRKEVTGKDGGPIETTSLDLSTLTDDQLQRLANGEDLAVVAAG